MRGARAVQGNPASGIQNGLMLRRMIQTLLLVGLNAASAAWLLVAMLLIKLGLRRQPDAWRRTLGVGLRSEASKFALSAFGLQALTDQAGQPFSLREQEEQFGGRLAGFLRTEPDAHFVLKQARFCTYRVPSPQLDLTLAQFSPSGTLQSIRPLLDERHPLALGESDRLEVEGDVIEEYNQTCRLPARARAAVLIRKLRKRWSRREKAPALRQLRRSYGERVVKSVCLSFEPITPEPPLRAGHLGCG